jgi:hypothetical protein
MVPASTDPHPKRRAARLAGHAPSVARLARGLEGALIDRDQMTIGSLEAEDRREFKVHTAGPAALLVAKLFKIQERSGSARASDKDALDVFRLLRGTTTEELVTRYRGLLAGSASAGPAKTALAWLKHQFVDRGGVGLDMMVRAAGPLMDAEELEASSRVLAADMLGALESVE